MKAMKLYTKCQVCEKEGEVPQQQGFLGGTDVSIPDGWWLVGQARVHDHDEGDCVDPPPRYVVCSVNCITALAALIPVELASK